MAKTDDIQDIQVFVGATWSWTMEFQTEDGDPIDMSGWDFFCEFRTEAGGTLIATPMVDDTSSSLGIVILTVEADVTKLIRQRLGAYDVLAQDKADPDNVQRLCGGGITFSPLVTVIV